MMVYPTAIGLACLLVLLPWHQESVQAAIGGSKKMVEISRSGSRLPTTGVAEYFTGAVRIDPLFSPLAPARASGASVTFQPGARTAWHTHPAGQILIVTSGSGLVQQWGGAVQEIKTGDVVRIPPGQKHWHGATPTTAVIV